MSHLPPGFPTTHFLTEGLLGLDLINSEHFDYRGRRPPQDLLEYPAWLIAWVQHWQLQVDAPLDALAMAELRALRALLRRMVVGGATRQPVNDAELEEFNSFLALPPMRQQMLRVPEGVGLISVPLYRDWLGWPRRARHCGLTC